MITGLLTLLSGTLMFSDCSWFGDDKPFGYYTRGYYNIYVCSVCPKSWQERVTAHELGHLFSSMYLKQNLNDENEENYAKTFERCAIDENCLPVLIRKIETTITSKDK